MWNLPRTIVNRMLGEAIRQAPLECVGVLSGLGREITGCHPLPNVAADPRRHFLADPAAQIALFRRLREEGREVVALYHSHPEGGAEPSATDLAQADYPQALFLILSLGVAGRVEIHGYLLQEGRVEPQEIQVVDG